MPKPGFRSITVSNFVYEKFLEKYVEREKLLELKGITSFSGFITYKLNEILQKDDE